MKFIHLGDTHIGKVYKDERRNEDIRNAFVQFVDKTLEINPDFIVHSGDLFNEGMPRLEDLIFVTDQLLRLKNAGIKVFIVPGSHDIGMGEENSILELFDRNGLLVNLNSKRYISSDGEFIYLKGETYKNAFIAGIRGKRSRVSEEIFKRLRIQIDQNAWIKIFIFHHTISALGEIYNDIETTDLPRGFDYYAAGHWHGFREGIAYDKGIINYPGSLEYCDEFEITNYNFRGFFVVEYNEKGISGINYVRINTREKEVYEINCENKSAEEIFKEIINKININNGKLLVIKLFGKMKGKRSELDIEKIKELAKSRGYSYVSINISKLEDTETIPIFIGESENTEAIEKEYLASKGYGEREIEIAKMLLASAENKEDIKLLLDKLLTKYDH
jgi:DNA repair exonuclease SbcCD nuclease subunit